MFSANASQVSNDVKYIEDFCSVYLRTGTGSSQTVTTGVKENTGALVISKSRSAATDWAWYDTFRGATKELASNTTAAEITQSQGLTSFNTDGHTWGTLAKVNTSGATYVDFVLKPTPKFFDVVTYTGDGTANRTVAHNLGSVPGCIIVKRTDSASGWYVLHKDANMLSLQTTAAALSSATTALYFGDDTNVIRPTSTVFTIGSAGGINASGGQYVALVFAHNAGGFGLTGTDNVISCGSYTGNGVAGNAVTLGYEPQYLLIKKSSGTGNWVVLDNMRGLNSGGGDVSLWPNLSSAEANYDYASINATGFTLTGDTDFNASGGTYIYIAIRRGPMKTPTSGTSVFAPVFPTSTTTPSFSTGWPVDLAMHKLRASASFGTNAATRLQGTSELFTSDTAAESADTSNVWSSNSGYGNGFTVTTTNIGWMFRRAPGFFDEVCYTGTGVARTVPHNLGVVPELMIARSRSAIAQWYVYAAPLGNTKAIILNGNGTPNTGSEYWNNTTPTSSVFTVGVNSSVNGSGRTQVAYLFTSCPGVSKCGSYTGTGTTQQINCGFTSGARFIMVKSTSTTGDWIVVDTARGLVSGNDPTLALNSTAAEVTTNDWFDPYSAGFELSSVSGNLANTNGTSYIYLAIA